MSAGPSPPSLAAQRRARTRVRLQHAWPWLIWCVVLGGVLWLHSEQRRPRRLPAEVELREVPVTAPALAGVARVLVQAGEAVEEGQVVALLDTRPLDEEILAAEAEVRRLEREIERQRLGLSSDSLDQARRMSADAEQATQALVETATKLAGTEAQLQSLEQEEARQRALVEQRLAPADALEQLARERSRLAQEREGLAKLQRLLRQRSEAAVQRLDRWRRLAAGSAQKGEPAEGLETLLAPLRGAVEVARHKLEGLEAQRERYSLRAPAAGTVTSVLRWAGAVAGPQSPVLTLVPRATPRVVAYVDEREALLVSPGQEALLRPRDAVGPPLRARVEALAPDLREVPPRFRAVSSRPTWARALYLIPEEGPATRALLPGRAFDAELLDSPPPVPPHDAFGPAPAPGSGGEVGPAPDPALRELVVPAALQRRSRFEPSGVAWEPRLERYLIVSDDTGWEQRGEHAPWVFAADAALRVDPEPWPIAGLEEISDLESITRSPEGLFLLASQSLSRKGRRPVARQLLLLATVQPEGSPRLRLRAQAPLLEAILQAAPAQGAAWLASLGLGARAAAPAGRPERGGGLVLDIEGMAWHEGALLLGLKEPLSPRNKAILWRLADPLAFLESGALRPGQLSPFAELALEQPGPEASPRAFGVSDLVFDPQGTLWVSGTLSGEGDPPWGGIWRTSLGAEAPPSATLRRGFPGRKPEGLSFGPSGALLVLFDEGARTPLWWQGAL